MNKYIAKIILCIFGKQSEQSEQPEQPKVYCGECRYFRDTKGYKCIHPLNETSHDTFKNINYTYIDVPQKININNDCPWFKEYISIHD